MESTQLTKNQSIISLIIKTTKIFIIEIVLNSILWLKLSDFFSSGHMILVENIDFILKELHIYINISTFTSVLPASSVCRRLSSSRPDPTSNFITKIAPDHSTTLSSATRVLSSIHIMLFLFNSVLWSIETMWPDG